MKYIITSLGEFINFDHYDSYRFNNLNNNLYLVMKNFTENPPKDHTVLLHAPCKSTIMQYLVNDFKDFLNSEDNVFDTQTRYHSNVLN